MQKTRLKDSFLLRCLIWGSIVSGFYGPARAQTGIAQTELGRSSLHVGLGPSFIGTLNSLIRWDYVDNYGMLTLRVTSTNLSRALITFEKPRERNSDYGLLYGWKFSCQIESYEEILTVSIASSVAYTRFIRQTSEVIERPRPNCIFCSTVYGADKKSNLGIPVELRIGMKKAKAPVGFSIGIWQNFNGHKRFGGVTFGAFIG